MQEDTHYFLLLSLNNFSGDTWVLRVVFSHKGAVKNLYTFSSELRS